MKMVAYIKAKGIAIEYMNVYKIDFHNGIDVNGRVEREWFLYYKPVGKNLIEYCEIGNNGRVLENLAKCIIVC